MRNLNDGINVLHACLERGDIASAIAVSTALIEMTKPPTSVCVLTVEESSFLDQVDRIKALAGPVVP